MTKQSIVAELVGRLNDGHREAFEERAGIMEFDAGLTREHAECLALLDLYRSYPDALLGVVVTRLPPGGYVLAKDEATAQAKGVPVNTRVTLSAVLTEFGGVARISEHK